MRGHGHDRPGPIRHEDVVRHPDRYPLAVDRVESEPSGRDAGLLALRRKAIDITRLTRARHVLAHLGLLLLGRDPFHQRMLRGQHHERGSEQRVRPRGVDAHRLALQTDHGEVDLCPLAAPDPVGLHDPHLGRPLVQQRQVVEQTIRILSDTEKPLLEVALLDLDVRMAPAPSVDDLLVREHCLIYRAPVDGGHRTVGQPALVEQQEEPLGPPVVIRQAAGDLPVPVIKDSQHLQLASGLLDIAEGPRLRVHAAPFHGGVLRGQPERVPAKRMEHLEALHPLHACQHVTHHVIAGVADREVARWVRVHDEVVVLRVGRVVRSLHDPVFGPHLLPLGLDVLGYVAMSGWAHALES